MSFLDFLSSGLTAGTQGAGAYLQGQQRGRKEQDERARQMIADLRQKRIDEQNALMAQAQIGNFKSLAEDRLRVPVRNVDPRSPEQRKLDAEEHDRRARLAAELAGAPKTTTSRTVTVRPGKAPVAEWTPPLPAGARPASTGPTKEQVIAWSAANPRLPGETDEARKARAKKAFGATP